MIIMHNLQRVFGLCGALYAIRSRHLEDNVAGSMTEVGNLYIGCRLDDNGACLLTQSTGNVCTHINTKFGAGDAGRGMEIKLETKRS